jgi:hypothetical protein
MDHCTYCFLQDHADISDKDNTGFINQWQPVDCYVKKIVLTYDFLYLSVQIIKGMHKHFIL